MPTHKNMLKYVKFCENYILVHPPSYTANDSQGMCTVCKLSAVVATSLVGSGKHLNTFLLFLLEIPIMKWIDKEKGRLNVHVCETEVCLSYQCSIYVAGEYYARWLLSNTIGPAVQWMSVVRSGELFWKNTNKVKMLQLCPFPVNNAQ